MDNFSRDVSTWMHANATKWSLFGSSDHFKTSFSTKKTTRIETVRISMSRAMRQFLATPGVRFEIARRPCADAMDELLSDDTYILMAENRKRHIDGLDDLSLREQLAKLQEEIGRMHSIIATTASPQCNTTLNNTTNHTTTNNTTNNMINYITINDFGKEDMSFMQAPEDLMKLRNNGVMNAINQIHFNDDHKENRNVRLKSIKKALVEVVQDGCWTPRCMVSVSDEMIKRAFDVITRRYVTDTSFREEMMEANGDGLMEWYMQMCSVGHDNKVAMMPIRRDLKALMVSKRMAPVASGAEQAVIAN
jgi:hypothetical protein